MNVLSIINNILFIFWLIISCFIIFLCSLLNRIFHFGPPCSTRLRTRSLIHAQIFTHHLLDIGIILILIIASPPWGTNLGIRSLIIPIIFLINVCFVIVCCHLQRFRYRILLHSLQFAGRFLVSPLLVVLDLQPGFWPSFGLLMKVAFLFQWPCSLGLPLLFLHLAVEKVTYILLYPLSMSRKVHRYVVILLSSGHPVLVVEFAW